MKVGDALVAPVVVNALQDANSCCRSVEDWRPL